MPLKLFATTIILSFLGFLDATYLTILHYKHVIPPCTLAHGCETVLTSSYAMIGPIPIALIGSIYFLIMIILLILLFQNKLRLLFYIITLLACLSLIISVILVYIQANILHAFCQYCLANEVINILIAITALINFITFKYSSLHPLRITK